MVGWHGFEQAPGVGDRRCKESDMTERLNWVTHSRGHTKGSVVKTHRTGEWDQTEG